MYVYNTDITRKYIMMNKKYFKWIDTRLIIKLNYDKINCLTNINDNSLFQGKNDTNSSLVMSESLHSSQQHTIVLRYTEVP